MQGDIREHHLLTPWELACREKECDVVSSKLDDFNLRGIQGDEELKERSGTRLLLLHIYSSLFFLLSVPPLSTCICFVFIFLLFYPFTKVDQGSSKNNELEVEIYRLRE